MVAVSSRAESRAVVKSRGWGYALLLAMFTRAYELKDTGDSLWPSTILSWSPRHSLGISEPKEDFMLATSALLGVGFVEIPMYFCI